MCIGCGEEALREMKSQQNLQNLERMESLAYDISKENFSSSWARGLLYGAVL